MFSKSKINPRIDGIYVALHKKNNTKILSAKTVNKLLQILYDDLREINNTVYCDRTRTALGNPAAVLTRDIVRQFIKDAGQRDPHSGLLIPEENAYLISRRLLPGHLSNIRGFASLQIYIGQMLSKFLYVDELAKAKTLLEECSFLRTDPNRSHILNFIQKAELKAQYLKKSAIQATMSRMHTLKLFRRENITIFTQLVTEYINPTFLDNKARLVMKCPELSAKRKVKHFRSLSTEQLKQGIEKLLNSSSGVDALHEKMALLERLNELHRNDVERYKQGDRVTLYYTGTIEDMDWYTLDECQEQNYPLINACTRDIPSEITYIEEANRLRAQYDQRQLTLNNVWETPD
ncbi:hypothetical protein [Enterobacter sp. Bisph1]|uniref:hypothetical protein n=1 Tax=Enterobacter sp. Bisph1 TaxID=1274399 RepID=UPI00057BD985|nr:hypothetical protein [Enterobacter sp. Bisph1]